MRLLVTGSEGYIGTVLCGYLLARGHDVTGLDTGFHRVGWLYNGVERSPTWINRDIRTITVDDLRGYDGVVHLAELSNDPVGALNPDITFEINHRGSVRLATLAREAGVERFIYMSSCSVYGAAGETASTETSEVLPLTAYAKCKVLVERDVHAARVRRLLADLPAQRDRLRGIAADALRPRRQRPGRPCLDRAGHPDGQRRQAVAAVRPHPRHQPGDRSGPGRPARRRPRRRSSTSAATCRTTRSARSPRSSLTRSRAATTEFGDSSGDSRNYRAAFDKIRECLPFETRYDVARGAQQLLDVFRAVDMTTDLFEFRGHTRIKQIQHLLSTQQIDDSFYWIDPPRDPGAASDA